MTLPLDPDDARRAGGLAATHAATSDRFNHSRFGRFINSPEGRVFRLVAGTGFLVAGLLELPSLLGIGLLVWSALPLSAGALDICWISAALGGPLTGRRIRSDVSPSLVPRSGPR
jgi:hypothetical protein